MGLTVGFFLRLWQVSLDSSHWETSPQGGGPNCGVQPRFLHRPHFLLLRAFPEHCQLQVPRQHSPGRHRHSLNAGEVKERKKERINQSPQTPSLHSLKSCNLHEGGELGFRVLTIPLLPIPLWCRSFLWTDCPRTRGRMQRSRSK